MDKNEPVTCLWDASRKNSQQWCVDHVDEWAEFITSVIDRVNDANVACEIACGEWFTFKRNTGMKRVEAIISAVALNGDKPISKDDMDTWELEMKYPSGNSPSLLSTTKSGGMFIVARGEDKTFTTSSKDVATEYIKFMRDPLHIAPKIVLMVRVHFECSDITYLRNIMGDVYDQMVNDSESTTYVIHNSGVHFTLDMGLSKAAEWHSGGDLIVRLSKIGGSNTMEMSATW